MLFFGETDMWVETGNWGAVEIFLKKRKKSFFNHMNFTLPLFPPSAHFQAVC